MANSSSERLSGRPLRRAPARSQDRKTPKGTMQPTRTNRTDQVYCRQEKVMLPKKTLHEREQELRSMLATPAGLEKLQQRASRYAAASGKLWRPGTSAITFVLV